MMPSSHNGSYAASPPVCWSCCRVDAHAPTPGSPPPPSEGSSTHAAAVSVLKSKTRVQGCIEIVSYRNSVGLLPIHHCIEIVSHRNSIRKCRLFCEKRVCIEIQYVREQMGSRANEILGHLLARRQKLLEKHDLAFLQGKTLKKGIKRYTKCGTTS